MLLSRSSVQADRVAGSLQPGDHATRRNVDARFCIGGISKAFLIGNFGLTAAQADDFFKKPITVHLNITLLTRFVDLAFVSFGVRLFGD